MTDSLFPDSLFPEPLIPGALIPGALFPQLDPAPAEPTANQAVGPQGRAGV